MRRLGRWMLNALTVLSVVMCAACFVMGRNLVYICAHPVNHFCEFFRRRISDQTYLSIGRALLAVMSASAIAPLAWMTLRAIALTSWLRRRRAASRLGLCPYCGYDMRATRARCPECGTATKEATA